MTPAGQLDIRLQRRDGQVTDVEIVSSRPQAMTKLLHGQTPQQLLKTLPLLFSLCGNAQAYAALIVCRSVLALPDTVGAESARQLLLQAETLREHAWRILLDWPGFIGIAADKPALAALLKFDPLLKRALFDGGEAFQLDSRLLPGADLHGLLAELQATVDAALFAGGMAAFLHIRDEDALRAWLRQNSSMSAQLLEDIYRRDWADLGSNSLGCLLELSAADLENVCQADPEQFSRQPQWQGQCRETTVLNRQLTQPLIADLRTRYGNGLLVRLVAQLREVAEIPVQLFDLAGQIGNDRPLPPPAPLADGIAWAQLPAARGLLIHRLVLREGLVYDYRIIAPTEWNFHPQGVVAQGLRTLRGNDDSLRRQAALWITGVDPCVQYQLSLVGDGFVEPSHC
jgi:coenzyme F420-reducing hydrogenase alpha subunit